MQIELSGIFRAWIANLRDGRVEVVILARIDRLQAGNLGDRKSLGGGLYELRIAYGPGYRLYFVKRGLDLVLLLCGGDKGSQSRDIEQARRLAKELD